MRNHHHHHDFVDGMIIGSLLSGKEPSGGTAFWIGVILICGAIEFAFDHIGLLLILGILALVIGIAFAVLALCCAIVKAACDWIASLPKRWDNYLNEPPW